MYFFFPFHHPSTQRLIVEPQRPKTSHFLGVTKFIFFWKPFSVTPISQQRKVHLEFFINSFKREIISQKLLSFISSSYHRKVIKKCTKLYNMVRRIRGHMVTTTFSRVCKKTDFSLEIMGIRKCPIHEVCQRSSVFMVYRMGIQFAL